MSYISQYVHSTPTQPAKKVVTEFKKARIFAPQNNIDSKESLLKILMFIAIVMCIILAVNL